ncbi:hypothetical protein GY45DRAFT_124062 [Cubamyces sp. BRFM 1775]|nr:hypothetical protein GY45DRAFT_124062 [Cubamyces sp. BRFM 1775]
MGDGRSGARAEAGAVSDRAEFRATPIRHSLLRTWERCKRGREREPKLKLRLRLKLRLWLRLRLGIALEYPREEGKPKGQALGWIEGSRMGDEARGAEREDASMGISTARRRAAHCHGAKGRRGEASLGWVQLRHARRANVRTRPSRVRRRSQSRALESGSRVLVLGCGCG